MKSLIIARLIETGYRVYIPLHKSIPIIVQLPTGEIKLCELQNASIDAERAPIAREMKDEACDMLGVVDGVTKTVWIIPRESLEGRKSIRLGARYEEFIIPEPTSLSYKEQKKMRKGVLSELRNAARELGEKKGMFDDK